MIAKRIDRKIENDNYRALALYIGGFTEREPNEKMLDSWTVCCEGEDYAEALQEIECVQDNNTSQANKTYHLILSFRPQDEEKLSLEAMRDIEQKFAEALGYAAHQRCCGVHKNTNNVHMHIAYNMINSETLKRHEQFRDFIVLSRVCREIEQQYGLAVDNGMEPEQEPTRPNIKAQTMEAQAGQESFDSYVKRHAPTLLVGVEQAQTWQYLHNAFASYGIGIKPVTNGLVLYDLHGKQHLKASSLGRGVSKKNLETRLGPFIPAPKLKIQEIEKYSKRPLQKEPNRGKLYEKYLAALEQKKAAYDELDELKADEQQRRAEIKAKWHEKRQDLHRNTKMTAKDRWGLIQKTYLLQKDELAAAGTERQEKHKQIRAQYPFSSWTDFLKNEVREGNETALDILRSKKIVFEADQAAPAPTRKKIDNSQAKQDIINNPRLATKDKKKFMAVAKLEEKTGEKCKINITPTGVLIIRFESGVTIRDTGKEVFFDKSNNHARQLAEEYAKSRWGKMSREKESSFVLVTGRQVVIPKKEQGMER